jgi:hypothetical protein
MPARPTAPASYPISVRQVATLLPASFRQALVEPPSRFASASPPSGCTGDLHPQAVEHVRHTSRHAKGRAPFGLSGLTARRGQASGLPCPSMLTRARPRSQTPSAQPNRPRGRHVPIHVCALGGSTRLSAGGSIPVSVKADVDGGVHSPGWRGRSRGLRSRLQLHLAEASELRAACGARRMATSRPAFS